MKKQFPFKSYLVAFGVAMAMHASVQAQNFHPIPLTPGSFTQAVVVPVDWTYKLNNQAVTVTIDHGPTLQTDTVAGFPAYYSIDSGDTFFEIGLSRGSAGELTEGLPAGGSLLTNVTFNSHWYQLPYWTNYNSNCVCIGNFTTSGTYNSLPLTDGPYIGQNYNANVNLKLNNTTSYTALSFLCSGGGPNSCTVTIAYNDGTTQGPVSFGVPNWFVNSAVTTSVTPSASFAYTAAGRCNPSENNNNFALNTGVTSGSRLWSVDIALSDISSYPTNLTFAWVSGNAAASAIFAVSGSVNAADNATIPNTGTLTGPFAPIPVSGYNAGCVVANSPQTLAGLAPLTATIDNGTNLAGGANTFFEQGWDAAAPTNGFPVHNTIITSSANPTRSYQMPASYHQNMCTLIDTNHQLANITPQSPASYVAFSLLTCGGNIGGNNTMTNYIILQHNNGVNESNLFYGYDWFNTAQPVAYNCNERVNIGTSASTSGREVQNLDSTDPRLFESEFQMQDGSPVTNIQVGFLTSPANAATTYIIAVSATTQFIPVQFGTNTTAQNVYAGQSAVFHAQLAFGTLPTYQWQVTDGATYTNNLPNGPTGTGSTVSGATTSTLTIANVSAADTTVLYTCQANNSIPSTANSTPAPLSLLVSTLADIAQPGDTISDFGETIASPAGLTLPNVIDGTMATYLNYGSSGNTAGPFNGPVGIILTPHLGSTIVSALRFVTAVNAPMCDPADYMLEGSNDGGNTWATIVADTPLNLPLTRNIVNTGPINTNNQALQEVDFANATAYSTYRLTIDNVRTNATANSMQIAEIQFLGTQALIAPGFLQQPAASQTLFVGGTVTMSVIADGPTPITYQWSGPSGPILGATNASYTLSNAQTANSGNYSCVASNPYGSTPSSSLALTVLAAPNAYVSTITADHPIAYWRLNEAEVGGGDNGVVATDYVGAHDGVYTNVVLDEPGHSTVAMDTAMGVETANSSPSFMGYFSGNINFAAPTNVNGEFSIEAWASGYQPVAQTINGAGIVTMGLGNGGEQFSLDCGANGASADFRFYFREAGGASVNANSSVGATNNVWHHLVGVLDEANNNQLFFVDGVMVASNSLPPHVGVLNVTSPTNQLWIGARTSSTTSTIPTNQFEGNIDEVAIYNYALTTAQVQNHYFVSGIAPTFTTAPASMTNDEGTTATFTSQGYGSPTLQYQWYQSVDGGGSFQMLNGQTAQNLILNNVQQNSPSYEYEVTLANGYGTVTSPPVTLTVVAGPPIISADLQPPYYFCAGFPMTLTVGVQGTVPFTYGWWFNGAPLANNARISGVNSATLTISPTMLSDSGNYQLFVTNSAGAANSVLASVTIQPYLSFNGLGGGGWSLNGGATYPANNELELTDGADSESRDSFFGTPVNITAFEASWIYQDVNAGGADTGADGTAFVVQNDPRGAAATGAGGGDLGYTGITPSAAVEYNIYAGNGFNGIGVAFSTNGLIADTTYTGGVDVASGDPIGATLIYVNGEATLTLTDTVTTATFTMSKAINLPSVLGANVAYVGFTGATGGTASTQTVSNFQFENLFELSAQISGNNVIITWPVLNNEVGVYNLQTKTALEPAGGWSNVLQPVTVVGGNNQVTIPMSGSQAFYRLQLQ